MEMQEFMQEYRKYKWFYLLDNPQVKEFVSSYNNKHTRRLVCKTIDIFVREVEKDNPGFKISDIFSLSPIEARKLIWRIVQRTMNTRGKSNITAKQIKSYLSLLYNETLEESGKTIVWKRKHRISTVLIRPKQVPRHEQVWRMIDFSTHLRDKAMIALSYCTGLKNEALTNLNVSDLRPLLEDFKENGTEPLILRITPRIYPKRFRGSNGVSVYHSLITKDCSKLLLRYYEEQRKDASDNEPFFVTLRDNRMGVARFSNQIEYLVSKIDKQLGGNRKNIRASLLRDSFYNRLISGGMNDAHREYLMMHSSIRSHYFNWQTERESIIEEYLKCNFNRTTEDNEVKRRVEQQETELATLRKQVAELEELNKLLKKWDVRKMIEEAGVLAPKGE